MNKKKTSLVIKIGLYGFLGIAFLGGGLLYARYEKRGITGALPSQLGSQFINNLNKKETPKNTLTPEKIRARIDQLEAEIVQETNDPDRALALRREVQNLRNQLQELEQ